MCVCVHVCVLAHLHACVSVHIHSVHMCVSSYVCVLMPPGSLALLSSPSFLGPSLLLTASWIQHGC